MATDSYKLVPLYLVIVQKVVGHFRTLVDLFCGYQLTYCFPILTTGDCGALYNKHAKLERRLPLSLSIVTFCKA